MSTLQHIPQQTFRSRLGHGMTVALVIVVLALAAVVAGVAVFGGDGGGGTGNGTAAQQSIAQTDPKYWVTHNRPVVSVPKSAQLGSKAQTDPKYFVTHQLP